MELWSGLNTGDTSLIPAPGVSSPPSSSTANVLFYVDGTPRTWFKSHEDEITSWDLFKEKIRELFGDACGRQLAAKKALATRVQTSTESYVSYILDVLALCSKADQHMSEDDKVGHVLKGIADDAFSLLVFNNVTSIDTILKECRRLEQAKSRRLARNITRLPNTASSSSCEDVFPQPPRCDNLTRIIRREVEAAQPVTSTFPTPDPSPTTISVIQAVVREELSNIGLHPVGPVYSAEPFYRRASAPRPYTYARQHNLSEWRTLEDKPICFNCRRVGHIARYCHNHWASPTRYGFTNQASSRSSSALASSVPTTSTAPAAPLVRPRYDRSPSPARRQSRSPPARRAASPTYSRPIRPEN